MLLNLSKAVKVSRVKNAVAAGTTDVTSSTLDMTGFDGVMFIALLGDVLTTCVLSLQAQEGADSGGSDAALATGGPKTADFTADATSADNKVLLVDYYRPQKQYVTAVLKRGTANAPVDGIIAIQYNARTKPTTQAAEVIAAALAAGV